MTWCDIVRWLWRVLRYTHGLLIFAQWLLIVVGRFIEKQLAIVPMTLQLSFFRINKKKCCSV